MRLHVTVYIYDHNISVQSVKSGLVGLRLPSNQYLVDKSRAEACLAHVADAELAGHPPSQPATADGSSSSSSSMPPRNANASAEPSSEGQQQLLPAPSNAKPAFSPHLTPVLTTLPRCALSIASELLQQNWSQVRSWDYSRHTGTCNNPCLI